MKTSIKRFLTNSIAATALLLPLSLMGGAAQASIGSRDVNGNLPAQTAAMTGEARHVTPMVSRHEPDLSTLTPAQIAINPESNPDKRINDNPSPGHHTQMTATHPSVVDTQDLTPAQQLINPVFNPDKPLNHNP
jgi:hypothetical protein